MATNDVQQEVEVLVGAGSLQGRGSHGNSSLYVEGVEERTQIQTLQKDYVLGKAPLDDFTPIPQPSTCTRNSKRASLSYNVPLVPAPYTKKA